MATIITARGDAKHNRINAKKLRRSRDSGELENAPVRARARMRAVSSYTLKCNVQGADSAAIMIHTERRARRFERRRLTFCASRGFLLRFLLRRVAAGAEFCAMYICVATICRNECLSI